MTNLLISLFIKDKENVKDAKVRNAYGKMAGIVGICCNIFLFATKFFAGIITGAISITADAFNNLSDAASSIITLVGFGMAGKPAIRTWKDGICIRTCCIYPDLDDGSGII